MFDRIDPIARSGTAYRQSLSNVDVFLGDGRFVGNKRLAVTAADGSVDEITGDRFVLAAGARPTIPDTPLNLETLGLFLRHPVQAFAIAMLVCLIVGIVLRATILSGR